jgi:hypothetical protein
MEASAPALLLTKSWLGLPKIQAWEIEEEELDDTDMARILIDE